MFDDSDSPSNEINIDLSEVKEYWLSKLAYTPKRFGLEKLADMLEETDWFISHFQAAFKELQKEGKVRNIDSARIRPKNVVHFHANKTYWRTIRESKIMSTQTSIEWTELSWNPTTGCTKVSPGCENCYAETMARRLKAMGLKGYENGFTLTLQPDRLNEPLSRRKPSMYFVNSMSDLFHEDVPDQYINNVLSVISKANWHTFQILTKRAKRMAQFFNNKSIPKNLWVGVTVENKKHGLPRIEHLRQISASTRFISMEPLLEDLGLIDLSGINWVIVGGESGAKARPMKPTWAINIKDQCRKQGSMFFFKQWGRWGSDGIKRSKKANGRVLLGRIWNNKPQGHHLVKPAEPVAAQKRKGVGSRIVNKILI